jgi:hypothetical protein
VGVVAGGGGGSIITQAFAIDTGLSELDDGRIEISRLETIDINFNQTILFLTPCGALGRSGPTVRLVGRPGGGG